MWQWTYSGVDHSIPGNGGASCIAFMSMFRRCIETVVVGLLALAYSKWGLKNLKIPWPAKPKTSTRCGANGPEKPSPEFERGKRFLLVFMSIIFGVELGYKFATKTFIYVLNPCHVVTVAQIYLLSTPPSRVSTAVFRWQMHSLNGAILALAFPVLNTRLLPFEVEVYFIQHITMLIIPFYLLSIGGVYTMEQVFDFSWVSFTMGWWLLYHFLPLQILGLITQVNLNNMICPAISDPFHGQNYRLWATGHQSLLTSILGKSYGAISLVILKIFGGEVFNNSSDSCNGGKQNCATSHLLSDSQASSKKNDNGFVEKIGSCVKCHQISAD